MTLPLNPTLDLLASAVNRGWITESERRRAERQVADTSRCRVRLANSNTRIIVTAASLTCDDGLLCRRNPRSAPIATDASNVVTPCRITQKPNDTRMKPNTRGST